MKTLCFVDFERSPILKMVDLGEVTNDWPGICAMLLRKIIRDMYIGKGKEGFMQWQDENITYPQMEELIEEFVKRYYGSSISDAELKSEKSRFTDRVLS